MSRRHCNSRKGSNVVGKQTVVTTALVAVAGMVAAVHAEERTHPTGNPSAAEEPWAGALSNSQEEDWREEESPLN